MTMLIKLIAFLLGFYLGQRLLAALYRTIDLWYAVESHWPRMLLGVLGWASAAALIFWLGSDRWRPALAWGMIVFLAFFLFNYVLGRFLLGRKKYTRVVEIE